MAINTNAIPPWKQPGWHEDAVAKLDAQLALSARPRTGPVEVVKSWARSCVQVAPTQEGKVWVKHSYGLPPGEEKVLERLAQRWADKLPGIVATWEGAVAMAPLPGRELKETDPVEEWINTARSLGELAAGEEAHAEEWLALGVRDRRPTAWPETVELLLESPTLDKLEPDVRGNFESLVPDFVSRYEDAFQASPTLVHQDSGCCNVHISDGGPIFFDWADVVVGHPTFSCDRLLDQPPHEYHEPIIEAFLEPLQLTREEFRAMRRSNVLHEVLRYHDELSYITPDDPAHVSLSKSVCSQIRVLVEHEMRG